MQVPAIRDESSVAIEIPQELMEVFNISSNMEGVIPRLPQIKIIHAGQLFEMPDESKIGEFEGIILDQHAANAWWEVPASESEEATVPDCFSMNGITPEEGSEKPQCHSCGECVKNQFGSEGNGKACKNMKRLHVLMEGSLLPRRLTVPPTSIGNFEGYMTNLVDIGLPYACAVTQFSLEKKTYGKFDYASVKFSKNRVLEKQELFSVADFIKQYKDPARNQEIRAEEYGDTTETVDIDTSQEEPPPVDDGDIPF